MSVVISIRIPRELKEKLKELGIDYSKEIVEYLKRRVQEEYYKKLKQYYDELLAEAPQLTGDLATEFIREDRDQAGGYRR